MTDKEFAEKLTGVIRNKAESGWTITWEVALDTNDLEHIKLQIREPGREIGLQFPLDEIYRDYRNGSCRGGLDGVAEKMLEDYTKFMPADIEMLPELNLDLLDFAVVKDKIYAKLINTKWNQKLLETTPHISFLDLSIVFYLLLGQEKEEYKTAQIKETHRQVWEVSVQELYNAALKNMQEQQLPEFSSLNDILYGGKCPLKDVPELFVLTNSMRWNGAGTVLYPNLLETYAEQQGCDWFVLPCSVHEVLLMPYRPESEAPAMGLTRRKDELAAIIQSVNATKVDAAEILSDHPYIYRRENKRLMEL